MTELDRVTSAILSALRGLGWPAPPATALRAVARAAIDAMDVPGAGNGARG